jgi:DNA-binding response OmpR family regulator
VTKILVVDDEPTVRALVRDVLEMDGYDIVEAADGEAAFAAVAEHDPALMVLDVMMPGVSGLDVLRQLRRERSGAELPIILLTAASDDDTTWAGWTAGASVFLPKPFDPSHLLDWVERLISGEGDGAPAAPTGGTAAPGSGPAGGGPGPGDDGAPSGGHLMSEFGGLNDE